mmetsp:Transcript_58062/g.180393  ORF Transcript_58062/g.180393 Transcript_58062/m.180393 type:complete len:222 (+) Transcript_58062:115-780(+)
MTTQAEVSRGSSEQREACPARAPASAPQRACIWQAPGCSSLLPLRHLCCIKLEVLGLVAVATPLAAHLLLTSVLCQHLLPPLLGPQHSLEHAQGIEPDARVAREVQAGTHSADDRRQEAVAARNDLVHEAGLLHLLRRLPLRQEDHLRRRRVAHALRKRHRRGDLRHHAEASKRCPEVGAVCRVNDITQHRCCEALSNARAIDSNDEGLREVDPGIIHVDI